METINFDNFVNDKGKASPNLNKKQHDDGFKKQDRKRKASTPDARFP